MTDSRRRPPHVEVIDSHQHLGDCRVFDAFVSVGEVLTAIDVHGLKGVLLQPFPGAADPRRIHDQIAELEIRTDHRVRGIVSVSPHSPGDALEIEAERCVLELGFVAIKLHTLGHAVDPLSSDGSRVFALGRRLHVPVMVHTGGAGAPFASPSHCLQVARDYPDAPIILAHAGMSVATKEAGLIAADCPNVWLETSWCSVLDLAWLRTFVGPSRLLFGSDATANIDVELHKYEQAGFSSAELALCLGKNAAKVFGL